MNCNCSHCRTLLTVPDQAAHRMARCPVCARVFRVVPTAESMEETAGQWLLEDAEAASRTLQAAIAARFRKPAPEPVAVAS